MQEVGRQAGELYVFQRTPSFTLPMRNDDLEPEYVGRDEAALPRHARGDAQQPDRRHARPQSTRPFYSLPPSQRRRRDGTCLDRTAATRSWARSRDMLVNEEANEQVAEFVRGKIGEIVKDPKTAEKLKPTWLSDLRARGLASTRTITRPTTCPTCIWST